MSGSPLLLPLRLGVRAAELAIRGTREIIAQVAGLAGLVPEDARDYETPDFHTAPAGPPTRIRPVARPTQTQTASPSEPSEPPESPLPPERAEPAEPQPPERAEPAEPQPPERAEPAEPAHVAADVELVQEVAEPGAEDGAGAEVHIAEPWAGYRELRAADVIERLPAASAAELAAIELYELANRKRRTVIAAAQRELARRR